MPCARGRCIQFERIAQGSVIIMNYFVYNCHGQIVGNPKGYKTFRGAARVEQNHKGALWRTYFDYKDNGGTNNTVSRIKQGKDNEN